MKKWIFFAIATLILLQPAKSQVVFSCNFESAESRNWTEVCRSFWTDLWIGTATNHGGLYSMYVSSDQGATTNCPHGYPTRSTLMGKTVTLDTGYYILTADCDVHGFQFNNSSTWCAALSILLLPDTAESCTFYDDFGTNTGGYYIRPSYAILPIGMQYISETNGWKTKEAPFYIHNAGNYKVIIVWESDGSSTAPTGLHMAVDNIVIERVEAMPFHINVSTNNADLGTTTGDGWYMPNDTASITALPLGGSIFVGWSDNEIANPRQIVATTDRTIVANFAAFDTTGSVTIYLQDTVQYVDSIQHIDTVTFTDTIVFWDTLLVFDTATIFDTVTIIDTVVAWQLFDTVTVFDTIMVFDTITVYDTVYVAIEDVATTSWRIGAEGEYISVLGAEGETIRIFDAIGRQLHIQPSASAAMRFRMPSAGAYLVKVGNSPAKKVVLSGRH